MAEAGQQKNLQQFAFYKKAHKKDREHQVWEEGSHPQLMQNEQMLRQKLDYIHFNPVNLEKSVEHGFCGKSGRKRQRIARR